MTQEQLNAELEKGYQDMPAGNTVPMGQAFSALRKENGIRIMYGGRDINSQLDK